MVAVVHKLAGWLYVALVLALAVGSGLALVSQDSPYAGFIAGMALIVVLMVLPPWLVLLVITTRHWQELDRHTRLFAGIPLVLVVLIVMAELAMGLI